MPDIVGVRFKKAGKVYYFEPAGADVKVFDYVVVQTARGVELGQVTIAPKQVLDSEITAELKPITRKASDEDVKRAQDFAAKENNALTECSKMIAKLKLPMKLVSAEYNLDGTRLTFYFTAEERVDFRELVRELTAFFKTRIELRQIGPRDQAKIVGGLGRCGRALCCGSFLSEFNPVSIKMAKEQDLPLDPMKISGVCGRLQCCLAYESSQYREAKETMPKKGQSVSTPNGVGVVVGLNALKETVLVEMESQAIDELPVSQVTVVKTPLHSPHGETTSAQSEEEVPPVVAETAAPSANPTEDTTLVTSPITQSIPEPSAISTPPPETIPAPVQAANPEPETVPQPIEEVEPKPETAPVTEIQPEVDKSAASPEPISAIEPEAVPETPKPEEPYKSE